MNGSDVNALGYLLCGFPPSDLRKITPSVMKELNSDVLGKLHQCNEAQVKVLAIKSEQVWGNPFNL